MKPIKTRDVLLTLFGMMCLAAYILACRPAFSPDGSKILFASIDPEARAFSVALYDRQSQTLENILTSHTPRDASGKNWEGTEGAVILFPQWASDGRRAIVAWQEGKTLRFAVLPVSSKSPTRLFTLLLEDENRGAAISVPPPIIGNQLFLVVGRSPTVRRLDLITGEIKSQAVEREMEGVLLSAYGEQIYYLAKLKSDPQYEIGTLATDTLALAPFLTFKQVDVGELSGFFAISRDRSRIALKSVKAHESGGGGETRLLIHTRHALERTILVGPKSEISLGNVEWSPDGKLIYASYCRKVEGDKGSQYGILEVPITGQAMREIALVRCAGCEARDIPQFQFALSPDGKTAAAFTTYFSDESGISDGDRALYLVDLESPDRKAIKLPIPSLVNAQPGEQGQKKE